MKSSKVSARFVIALSAGALVLALVTLAILTSSSWATPKVTQAIGPEATITTSTQNPAPSQSSLPAATSASPHPAPSAESKTEELAWKAVERIDEKLANTVVFLTVFIAFIALVLGLYEFFKLTELEKLRAETESKVQALFDRQFEVANKEYERRLSEKFLAQIQQQTHSLADDQIKLSTVAHRIMLCFVQNDLSSNTKDPMTIVHMHKCMDLQRSLGQLRSSNDEGNLTGLSHLRTLSRRISVMTAGQILHYLVLVRRSKILVSWANQGLCADIITALEKLTGLSANDPAFQ